MPGRKPQRSGLNPRRTFAPGYAPDELFVTLEYTDFIAASAAANTYAYQWRINSLFDPNYTATGSQPVGYDELAAIYNKYLVYRAEIETTLSCADTAAVACVATPDNPPYLNTIVLGGMPHAKVGMTVKNGPPARFKTVVHVHVVFGVPFIAVETDDQFSSGVATNPTNTVFWNVAFDTMGATDVCSITQRIKMCTRMYKRDALNISLFLSPPTHDGAVALAARRAPALTATDKAPAKAASSTVTSGCDCVHDCSTVPATVAAPGCPCKSK
jgi:hypothetical protein